MKKTDIVRSIREENSSGKDILDSQKGKMRGQKGYGCISVLVL